MQHEISAVIPTILPRRPLLARSMASVGMQRQPVKTVIIEEDFDHIGAAETRNAGLARVTTEWTAFLDDDDEWNYDHLHALCEAQKETDADVLWPWFEVVGGGDPFPQHRGRQFDINNPHIFPICILVRTELAQKTNGFQMTTGDWSHDDLPFYRDLWNMGAKFHHVDSVTWQWHHHGSNTSGRPEGWRDQWN